MAKPVTGSESAVHPPQPQRPAVEQHLPPLHRDIPHPHRQADDLLAGAQFQPVEGRGLGGPEPGRIQRNGQIVCGLALCRGGSVRIPQLPFQGPGAAGPLHPDLDHRFGIPLAAPGAHPDIPDMLRGPRQQIHVPEDAGHAELVLTFQIGAHAPLEHQHRQQILPGMHKVGDIELAGGVGDLAVSHPLPVDPDVVKAVYPLKVQIEPPAAKVRVQGKAGAVGAAGVLMGHKGRIVRDGIPHVAVLVFVQPLHLPAGGHRHGGKLPVVKLRPAELLRHGADPVVQLHPPASAEQDESLRGLPRGGRILPGSKGNVVGAVRLHPFVKPGPVLKFMVMPHGVLLSHRKARARAVSAPALGPCVWY